MRNLKDYIKNNRKLFDDQEPPAGHAERFKALLDQQDRNKTQKRKKSSIKRFTIVKFISVAASIAILTVVAIRFYEPHKIEPTGPGIENNDEDTPSVEFRATNEYYRQQMEAQIADIMCKLSYTDAENQSQLSHDLNNLIKNNKVFIDEIANNDNEELAIYYLVKHYKANIEALENINEKLGKYTKC